MFVKKDLCWHTHSVFSVIWNKQWLQFWPYRNEFRHLFESSNTPGFNAKWSICFRKSDVLNLETVQRPQRHSTTHTNENENNICSPFYRSSSLRVWRQNGWLGLGMVTECAALTVCVKYNNIDCEYVSLEQHEFHITILLLYYICLLQLHLCCTKYWSASVKLLSGSFTFRFLPNQLCTVAFTTTLPS